MKVLGKILSFLLPICSFFLVNCGEDRTYEYLEITKENQWVYTEMKSSYMWRDSIKELGMKDFFGNSQTFFKKLLYKTDKTSCFTDTIATTSYGMSFVTMRDPLGIKTSDTYALVLDVEKGSPAYDAGVRRGTWIYKAGKYSISLGNNAFLQQGEAVALCTKTIDFDDETATYAWLEGDTLALDASREITTQAIPLDTIYRVREKIVGYVVCNSFNGENYAPEMQNVLSRFNSKGVKELIIDLRYNTGGALSNAIALAGMLLPADKNGCSLGKLSYSIEENADGEEFAVAANPLIPALEKIYILSTNATRGVAETFIAGIRSNDSRVRVLGEATMGDNLYTESIESPYGFSINPVVARLCLPDGTPLPSEGVYTDYQVDELSQIQNVYRLGDQQEYLLYSAIHLITTVTIPQIDANFSHAGKVQTVYKGRSIVK